MESYVKNDLKAFRRFELNQTKGSPRRRYISNSVIVTEIVNCNFVISIFIRRCHHTNSIVCRIIAFAAVNAHMVNTISINDNVGFTKAGKSQNMMVCSN